MNNIGILTNHDNIWIFVTQYGCYSGSLKSIEKIYAFSTFPEYTEGSYINTEHKTNTPFVKLKIKVTNRMLVNRLYAFYSHFFFF